MAFSAASLKKNKKVRTIRRADVVKWIKEGSKGRIFGIDIVKRTDGANRYMVARYGVRAHAKGIGLSFDPTAKQLIVVWDTQKHAYRMINIPGIRAILKGGEYFRVI